MGLDIAIINSVPADEGVGRYVRSIYNEINENTESSVTEYYINKKECTLTRRQYNDTNDQFSIPSVIDWMHNSLSLFHDRIPKMLTIFSLSRLIPDTHDIYHIADQNMAGLAYYDTLSPSVLTVHDLVWLAQPNSPVDRLVGNILFRGIGAADSIISISEFTKEDLFRFYPSTKDYTSVIYNGVDKRYFDVNKTDVEKFRKKHDMSKDYNYILHLGTDKPTKNIKTLLDVLDHLPADTRLVRTKPLNFSSAYADELNVNKKIINFGYIDHENIPSLYGSVDIYVNTSLYEGFGLPPLEAMAVGTPVVTSNAASLPEIIGDAGISCNPNNIDCFVDEINRLLSDDEYYSHIERTVRERAKNFSWNKCAHQTLTVYSKVLGLENGPLSN